MMLTRGASRLAALTAGDPMAGSNATMQSALDLVRKLRKEAPTEKDLDELSSYKKSLQQFRLIPGIEEHFLTHYVVATELLKLIYEIESENEK